MLAILSVTVHSQTPDMEWTARSIREKERSRQVRPSTSTSMNTKPQSDGAIAEFTSKSLKVKADFAELLRKEEARLANMGRT